MREIKQPEGGSAGAMPPPLPGSGKQRRDGEIEALWVILLPVAGLGALGWFWWKLPLLQCPLKGLTGWPCLTCGMQRGWGSLLVGDWAGAWHYNPLTLLLPLAVFLFWVKCVARLAGWRSPWADRRLTRSQALWVRMLVLVIVAALWIAVLAGPAGPFEK